MYGQSQCHYHDQEDGGGNNYRLTHGVIVAGTVRAPRYRSGEEQTDGSILPLPNI